MKWINPNEAIENDWYILLIGADKPFVRTGTTYYFSKVSFWDKNKRVNELVIKCFPLPQAPINEVKEDEDWRQKLFAGKK